MHVLLLLRSYVLKLVDDAGRVLELPKTLLRASFRLLFFRLSTLAFVATPPT